MKSYETLSKKVIKSYDYNYIGYGHLITDSESFDSITDVQATELMLKDLKIQRYLFVGKVPEKYLEMLSVLAYNCRLNTILKSNFYKEIVNDGNFEKIKEGFLSFSVINKKEHKKLKQRRIDELEILFPWKSKRRLRYWRNTTSGDVEKETRKQTLLS